MSGRPDSLTGPPTVRALEVRRRRADAAHPDTCPKLHLHGVAFAIPPRQWRVVPRFEPGGVRVEMVGPEKTQAQSLCRHARPEDVALCRRHLLALAAPRAARRCRRCGAPTAQSLELEARRDAAFLAAAFALARRLLLAQYELSDQELADLLALPDDAPAGWIAELLTWAAGPHSDGPGEPPRPWWKKLLARTETKAKQGES